MMDLPFSPWIGAQVLCFFYFYFFAFFFVGFFNDFQSLVQTELNGTTAQC